MNKEVIYIEPEDDITDIISKIENAKAKIVALVIPKKADIFRSAVNTKLIAKAGSEAKKSVVLVTTEPSVIKLAAIAKLPVTKDLKTVPTVPEIEEGDLKIVEIKNEEPTETEKTDEANEADEPDEETNCINIIPETKSAHFDMFLSNSFGFGGTNSTLIIKNL